MGWCGGVLDMAAAPLTALAGVTSLVQGVSAYGQAKDAAAAAQADQQALLARNALNRRTLERQRDQAVAGQRVKAGRGGVLADSGSSADVQARMAGQTEGDIALLNAETDARLERQALAARSANRRAGATLLTMASRFGSGIAGLEV